MTLLPMKMPITSVFSHLFGRYKELENLLQDIRLSYVQANVLILLYSGVDRRRFLHIRCHHRHLLQGSLYQRALFY